MQQYNTSQYLNWMNSRQEQLRKQIKHRYPREPILYGTLLGVGVCGAASAIAVKYISGDLGAYIFVSSIFGIIPLGTLLGFAASQIIPKMTRRRNEEEIRLLETCERNLDYSRKLPKRPYLLI